MKKQDKSNEVIAAKTLSSIEDYAEAVFGDSDDEAYFKAFISDKYPRMSDYSNISFLLK